MTWPYVKQIESQRRSNYWRSICHEDVISATQIPLQHQIKVVSPAASFHSSTRIALEVLFSRWLAGMLGRSRHSRKQLMTGIWLWLLVKHCVKIFPKEDKRVYVGTVSKVIANWAPSSFVLLWVTSSFITACTTTWIHTDFLSKQTAQCQIQCVLASGFWSPLRHKRQIMRLQGPDSCHSPAYFGQYHSVCEIGKIDKK